MLAGDYHGPGLGERLQARCQIWRRTDHLSFLRGAPARELADHDHPGGDADPRRERLANLSPQLTHRGS